MNNLKLHELKIFASKNGGQFASALGGQFNRRTHPDAISADLIRFRENIGFWVTLKSGAAIFYKLIEPIKYTSPNRCLFGLFGE